MYLDVCFPCTPTSYTCLTLQGKATRIETTVCSCGLLPEFYAMHRAGMIGPWCRDLKGETIACEVRAWGFAFAVQI